MAWDRIAIFLIVVLVFIVLTWIGKAIDRAAFERGKREGKDDAFDTVYKKEDKARSDWFRDGVASVKQLVAAINKT